MICYKDKTFCNQPCSNRECPNNFNEEIEKQAIAWWRSNNAPIMFDNLRTDSCGYVDVSK